MKKYTIIIEDSADAELRGSYEWGIQVWGKAKAQAWFRQMIREMKTLSRFPERMCLGYIWSALTCQRFGLRAALLAASLMRS